MHTQTVAAIGLLALGASAKPHRPDGPSPSWYSKYLAAKEALALSSSAAVPSINAPPPWEKPYPNGAFDGPPPSGPLAGFGGPPPPPRPWGHRDFQPLTTFVTKTSTPCPEESKVKPVISTVVVVTSDAKPQTKVYSSTSTLSTITTTITSSAEPECTDGPKPKKGNHGHKGKGSKGKAAKEIEEGEKEVAQGEADGAKGAKEVAEGEADEEKGEAEVKKGEKEITKGVSDADKAAWLLARLQAEKKMQHGAAGAY